MDSSSVPSKITSAKRTQAQTRAHSSWSRAQRIMRDAQHLISCDDNVTPPLETPEGQGRLIACRLIIMFLHWKHGTIVKLLTIVSKPITGVI